MTGELQLPAGFRFHPTDEELVVHYLCRRCAEQPIAVPIIAEIDLYKFDPWQLPEMALYGEKEWYFFSPRDRKYPNGSRPNRATATGYWKATGADKPIGKPDALGIKKALVFYAGKAPKGVKTNWIMHEYRLANVDRSAGKSKTTRLDDWVLCRLYNKKGSIERNYTFDRKPNVLAPPPPPNPEVSASSEVMFHMESSDSMPRVQTDSSGSDEQAASPELTSHREVQSESGWGDFGNGFYFPMEAVQNDYSTPPPQFQWQWDQMSPLQDMFMNLQN